VNNGNILGAILSASNTYNNAKKIKKSDIKEELKGIAKEGVLEIGKQAGTISNPVAQFTVGTAIAAGTLIASAKSSNDNKNNQNTRVLSNPVLDTTNYLTAEESANLIANSETIKDEIAAGIYYKDIGSRKDLTPGASDIEYANSSNTTKIVYRNKAITDIRKLVTDGYIKIDRQSQDVSISVEKVGL